VDLRLVNATSRLRSTVASAISTTAEALANAGIRRVQAAWLLGFAADTALLVAMMVATFGAFGAAGVAFLGAARMLPSTVFGFLAAAPLARWRPDRVLMAVASVRGVAALIAVAVFVAHANVVWLLAVAASIGAANAIARPAQHTVLPALARTPGELVTANVASSTGEALGSFAGPLIAAGCLALGAPAVAAMAAFVAQAISVASLSGVRFEGAQDERGPAQAAADGSLIGRAFAAIRRRPVVGLVILGFALQTLVRGLLATLIVVLSIELIGLGDPGVGILTAAIGIGGVAGLVGGLALRRSTPFAFAVALAGWGLPIAVIGAAPGVGIAVLALAVVGLFNALLDIVGFTLLQRGSRNEERGAVFALFEGAVGVGATIGSLGAPLLVALLGPRLALVGTGAILPVTAGVLWLLFRGLGEVDVVPPEAIERLRRVPEFAVLPLTGLERLAGSAVAEVFRARDVLMSKGERGDRFLVIEAGEVEVTDDGLVLDTLGPGAGVGEIALLRGGVRTATVTAVTDVRAQAFDALAFLGAVGGPAATAAVSRVVEARLARSMRDH
jgi:hypothetical protein